MLLVANDNQQQKYSVRMVGSHSQGGRYSTCGKWRVWDNEAERAISVPFDTRLDALACIDVLLADDLRYTRLA